MGADLGEDGLIAFWTELCKQPERYVVVTSVWHVEAFAHGFEAIAMQGALNARLLKGLRMTTPYVEKKLWGNAFEYFFVKAEGREGYAYAAALRMLARTLQESEPLM